jgi:hypothetical protein
MKRKIYYVVTIADRFVKNNNWAYPFDVPEGRQIDYTNLLIEFEQVSKDPIEDALVALAEWVQENHPGMDYRTYYWTLEFI